MRACVRQSDADQSDHLRLHLIYIPLAVRLEIVERQLQMPSVNTHRATASMCVWVPLAVFVCVCERERERERKRKRVSVCVCVRERERSCERVRRKGRV